MKSVGLLSSQHVRWLHGARTLLAFALIALVYPASAYAGGIQIRDTAEIFSSSDVAQLQAAANRYPFSVRVVSSTAYANQADFSRYVGSLVYEPNEVVVGVDPVHHHTQVHFGTGSHIASSEWPAIESAGNGQFRQQHWAPGVISILDQASAAVAGGSSASGASSSGGHGWAIGGIVMFLMILAIPLFIIFVIVMIVRRFSSGPSYGGPGYGGGGPGYGGPGYGGPGYGPGGGSGMGPVGGGLIGAGLGGIAGYELGKMEGEREERRNDGGGGFFDSGSSNNDGGSSNYDAGGGGSSWDSGSSGGDSGGGGGDFGGGGGDSGGGGGGSDW